MRLDIVTIKTEILYTQRITDQPSRLETLTQYLKNFGHSVSE